MQFYSYLKEAIAMKFNYLYFITIGLFFLSCESTEVKQVETEADPLPSWNDGELKELIIQFVEKTTDIQSNDYVDIENRIATFDNDGTLWSEQPLYFQLAFAIDRIKEMAVDHPEWNEEEPFRSLLENDMDSLKKQGVQAIMKIVTTTHAGMTTEEFTQLVKDWTTESKHPRFDRAYTDLIYQPMLELLDYLRDHNYRTYIISGGGMDFMRAWTYDAYKIPSDQVFGSTIKTKFDYNDGMPVIRRLAEIDFIDDKEGKPVGIHRFIGKRPIFAAGNSDGDLQMVQWATSGEGPRFGLFIHHTDGEREYAYDRNSAIGHFDKAWDEALDKGWSIVDMKNDWKVIYPFELKE